MASYMIIFISPLLASTQREFNQLVEVAVVVVGVIGVINLRLPTSTNAQSRLSNHMVTTIPSKWRLQLGCTTR